MFDLLRRCLEEDDADAWGDFWILYQHVVPNGVAAILSPAGFNAADVEDVAMDTYVRLAEADHRRLRTFRGDTAPQLIQWLRRLAVNSARDWLRTTASCRTRQLVEGGQFVTARDQCSAQKVEIALSELERSGNGDDIKKLRMISGLEILPDSISSRTVRHWCQTLCQRYASQLQHC